jgi:MFS family permease
VFMIRKKEPAVQPPADGHRSMREEIKEGLRYVWHHPLLRPIAFCTGSSNLFSSMFVAILVLFAVRVLHMRPGLIGLALAIGNLGFLLGAFSAQRIARRIGIGPAIVWSVGLSSPIWLLVPLATPSTGFVILVITGFVLGFGGMAVYNINQVSLRQAITPLRMQGRMNATMRFMVWGTMPIGSLVGGVLGNTIGLRPTLWVAAIGGIFAFLPPLFSPVRSLKSIPEHEEEPAELLAATEEGVVEPGHLPPAGPSEWDEQEATSTR